MSLAGVETPRGQRNKGTRGEGAGRGPLFLAVGGLKGGCGKTCVAVNLSAGLALRGRAVVLLDCDPLAAATFHLRADPPTSTLAEALDGRAALGRVLADTSVPGLRLAAASQALVAWDRRPERAALELARVLSETPDGTDTVLLDLPPSAGALTRGALAVLPGGRVLAPTQPFPLDLVGLADLLALLEEMRDQNAELHLCGVVPVRTNRSALSGEVLEALRREHGERLLPALRDSVRAARAPLRHEPVQVSFPRSSAAADVAALTQAVLDLVGDAR